VAGGPRANASAARSGLGVLNRVPLEAAIRRGPLLSRRALEGGPVLRPPVRRDGVLHRQREQRAEA
jgi:hypothetical protein